MGGRVTAGLPGGCSSTGAGLIPRGDPTGGGRGCDDLERLLWFGSTSGSPGRRLGSGGRKEQRSAGR